MKILLKLILIFLCGYSFAAVKLTGVIKKEYLYGFTENGFAWFEEKNTYPSAKEIKSFPRPKYDVFNIYIQNLQYSNSVPYNSRKINLQDALLSTAGQLNLISFDKNTGHFKFKLNLNSKLLSYTKHGEVVQRSVKGSIHFDELRSDFLQLEGKFTQLNDKAYLTNFYSQKNKTITLNLLKSMNMAINLLEDIPVSVELDESKV